MNDCTKAEAARLAALALGFAGALCSAGAWSQSAEWKAVASGAQREGRVVVYSAMAASILDRVKADFAKAQPAIVMEFTRFSSGPMLAKLEQERKTGADGGDVQISTEVAWSEDRHKEGALRKLIGPSAAAWPAPYMLLGAVPVLAVEPFGMVFNTGLVKTPIAGYKDLLRPEFKGRIGIIDLSATSIVAFYDWLEKREGSDFLQKLAAQQPRIYASNPIGAQMVASGELPVASFMNATMVVPLIAQGAPLKMVYPESVFGIRYVGGIPAWAKRPNAAQVFMDYIMSPRGQAIWVGGGEVASPLPNVPRSLDAKAINAYDPAPYTPAMVKSYRARWDGIFKK